MSNSFPDRFRHVMVQAVADDPVDAIEHHTALVESQLPQPEALQPTDVIIAIRSAAVGWVDLLMTSGLYQHKPTLPYTPGMEYAGVVSWIGKDVRAVQVGDAVMVDGFFTGPRSSGAYQHYGGFATHAVAPVQAVHPMPSEFSFDQGCNFFGNYETAYHCLIACGRVQAGETVLIHGASGATGLAAVHLAKLLGATVIATGRSDEKLRVVQEQGADFILNIKDTETTGVRRFRDEVKDITQGRGVDVVYDGVGGAVSLESLRCVAFGARYLIVGWAATPFVAKGQNKEPNPNMLPTNLIMMKGLQVLGCPTVIATQHHPQIRVKRLQDLMVWARAGQIRPYISVTYPLSQYKDAMLARWRGDVIGGCVLHP